MFTRRTAYFALGALLLTGLATLSWLIIDLALAGAVMVLGAEVRRLRARVEDLADDHDVVPK